MGSGHLENFIFNRLAFSLCRVIYSLWLFWDEGVILMLVWWLNLVLTFKLEIASILKNDFSKVWPTKLLFYLFFYVLCGILGKTIHISLSFITRPRSKPQV